MRIERDIARVTATEYSLGDDGDRIRVVLSFDHFINDKDQITVDLEADRPIPRPGQKVWIEFSG